MQLHPKAKAGHRGPLSREEEFKPGKNTPWLQTPADLIGPLYFGAEDETIPPFLLASFDGQPPRRRECGAVLLSSNIADVYEDGAYERYGCVLEVWLHKRTRWRYRPDVEQPGGLQGSEPAVWRRPEDQNSLDAIRAGSGEQWYVWNPRAVSIVRRLAYHEAIPLLCVALDEAGPAASFNGLVVHDYSCIWWGRIQGSPRLSVLAYRQQLERVLRRYVGRKRSLRLRDAAEPMGAARRAVRARELFLTNKVENSEIESKTKQ